jgi:hypothetical protein
MEVCLIFEGKLTGYTCESIEIKKRQDFYD